MSLPQHITKDFGGTVFIDRDALASSATVSVYDGDGCLLIDSADATVSSVNTTLTSAVSRGDLSITVESNTGLSNGSTPIVTDDLEQLLVRSIDDDVVYLRRPALHDHDNGSAVVGSRITYSVNSDVASKLWWDGRAEWTIDGTERAYTACECTKYPLDMSAAPSEQDLFDEEPQLYNILDSEVDVYRVRELALQEVLKRLASASKDLRARVYPGSMAFRRAGVMAAMMAVYRRQRGQEAADLYERYKAELDAEISVICQATPKDSDQDGVVEENEKSSYSTVQLFRS